MTLDIHPASTSPDPEAAALTSDSNAIVHRLIDALPEDLRRPLALSGLQEMNSRQIAAVMGIPEGTVRTRLVRARQILKEKLTRYL
jgi:RNA polymerase sigma-70 factor, ECF subfamily